MKRIHEHDCHTAWFQGKYGVAILHTRENWGEQRGYHCEEGAHPVKNRIANTKTQTNPDLRALVGQERLLATEQLLLRLVLRYCYLLAGLGAQKHDVRYSLNTESISLCARWGLARAQTSSKLFTSKQTLHPRTAVNTFAVPIAFFAWK